MLVLDVPDLPGTSTSAGGGDVGLLRQMLPASSLSNRAFPPCQKVRQLSCDNEFAYICLLNGNLINSRLHKFAYADCDIYVAVD